MLTELQSLFAPDLVKTEFLGHRFLHHILNLSLPNVQAMEVLLVRFFKHKFRSGFQIIFEGILLNL